MHTALIASKSRLAPIKAVTITRLEQWAGVMATLDVMLRRKLGMTLAESTFWTGNQTVLAHVTLQRYTMCLIMILNEKTDQTLYKCKVSTSVRIVPSLPVKKSQIN